MSRSPLQRFIRELRRRRVPQTTAIYLVAAWAAIEFADVVVPNLNGPQWVVTAVIVAALVGFPVMLVVAWVFERGPEGLHRTETDDAGSSDGVSPGTAPSGPQPWIAVATVLVVGIASALAAAFVIRGTDGGGEAGAPAVGAESDPVDRTGPSVPRPPELEALGSVFTDSILSQVGRAMRMLDSLDSEAMAELGRELAAEQEAGIVVSAPEEWQAGGALVPAALARGDSLVVAGAAVDTTGVAAVMVDGEVVAEPDSPAPVLPFRATLVGRADAGTRTVVITARTADGRELRREYQVIQLPGGTP